MRSLTRKAQHFKTFFIKCLFVSLTKQLRNGHRNNIKQDNKTAEVYLRVSTLDSRDVGERDSINKLEVDAEQKLAGEPSC